MILLAHFGFAHKLRASNPKQNHDTISFFRRRHLQISIILYAKYAESFTMHTNHTYKCAQVEAILLCCCVLPHKTKYYSRKKK